MSAFQPSFPGKALPNLFFPVGGAYANSTGGPAQLLWPVYFSLPDLLSVSPLSAIEVAGMLRDCEAAIICSTISGTPRRWCLSHNSHSLAGQLSSSSQSFVPPWHLQNLYMHWLCQTEGSLLLVWKLRDSQSGSTKQNEELRP